MDNQENQKGTPMPGADIRVENATTSSSTTGQATAGSPGTTTGSQRKTASAAGSSPSARSSAQGNSSQQSEQESQQSEGNILNTAFESGRRWIEDTHVLDSVNQLPQNVKEWSNRAVSRVGGLSTTQKVVGGAILAAGLGWLAMRKGKSGSSASPSVYGRQGNASYARKSGYGYQSPESGNRRPAATSGRSSSSPSFENSTNMGSDRKSGSTGSYGGASSSDYGSRTSEGSYGSSRSTDSGRSTDNSYRSGDDYRSIE